MKENVLCLVYDLGHLLFHSPLLFSIIILQSAIMKVVKDGHTVGFGLSTGLVKTKYKVGRCNKLVVCSYMQHSSCQSVSEL